jgi:hypothetical protein
MGASRFPDQMFFGLPWLAIEAKLLLKAFTRNRKPVNSKGVEPIDEQEKMLRG